MRHAAALTATLALAIPVLGAQPAAALDPYAPDQPFRPIPFAPAAEEAEPLDLEAMAHARAIDRIHL